MKVLILGSKGNLGPELAKVYKMAKPTLWDQAELDITDEAAVTEKINQLKPELVFNCAAYNAVDKAEGKDRMLSENVNGLAVGFIAQACNSVGAVLVQFSSNYVFDGNKSEGYNEDDLPNPISAYGKSKLMGEIELQKNCEKYYLVRTAWLYGGKGIGKKSFVDLMLEKAEKKESIEVIADEFGNPTYVVDLAQAVGALVEQNKPFGIYHLTNSGQASWYDWAKEIFTIKGIDAKLSQISSAEADTKWKRPAKRPKYGILNNTKFIELRPWSEALREYLS
ncbi:MAG: dTDP-4-dehydrorhamnose reductase [Candidatus Doudnabacteria bacterium]|nr:dTDP-4-dehydrorhamnose reductase [Candidatus Doudnabacteria bacterium]